MGIILLLRTRDIIDMTGRESEDNPLEKKAFIAFSVS